MSIERAETDLARVRSEIQRLQMQLEIASARSLKLEHYIEMARLYDVADASEQPDDPRNKPGSGSPLVPVCVEYIRQTGQRQPTRKLVEVLEAQGFKIGGTNKVTNLSGSLSRAPELTPNRVEGWGLKEWEARNADHDSDAQPDVSDEEIAF